MKKLVALLLAIVMVVGIFAGCNTEKPVETNPQETQDSNKPAETQPQETEKAFSHPITTDPITITILTRRHTTATNQAGDTWFFQHLENWLNTEHGYNITLNVQETQEPAEQISLLLGTDSLPDLIWGIELSNTQAVVFGEGEEMLLDWNAWLNETYMPNAYSTFQSADYADALAASTAPNGGVYSMPQLSGRGYNTATSSLGPSQDRMFIYTPWLEAAGLSMPTNMDEFYAMLEAFQGMKAPDGTNAIAIMGQGGLLEKALWTMLGYYGGQLSKYGTSFAIKNEEVVLPVYTEDYKTFVQVMNTMYTEGYLSPDHFTLDKNTVRGLTSAGVAGVVSDYTMAFLNDYTDWDCMPWFPINEGDEIVISAGTTYTTGTTWASASTEYPEILALIVDYMYTVEGQIAYNYGPKQGEDPFGLVDGWYFDETGKMTTKLVEEGVYDSYEEYCYQYIFPYSYVAGNKALLQGEEAFAILGKNAPTAYKILDTITGEEFTALETTVYDDSTAQGYWFLRNSAVSRQYITTVNLPAVFMSEDDALYTSELLSVLKNHIESETAKFIVGLRPLSELDTFMDELKGMGIEEYINIYKEAYAPFMDTIY